MFIDKAILQTWENNKQQKLLHFKTCPSPKLNK